jgi:DNA polymerase IIIc chi subunit
LDDADVSEKQFEQAQAILNHFWHRWLKEYVPHLTERRKWSTDRPNVKVGDLVLVIEPNTPRGQWPLGTVLEVTPNAVAQVVRVAKVKVSTHTKPCVRPVSKLCVLVTTQDTKPNVKPENKPKPIKKVRFE